MQGDGISPMTARVFDSHEPTLVLDGESLEVVAVNPPLANLVGRPLAELLGQVPDFLRAEDSGARHWERTRQASLVKPNGAVQAVEVTCLYVEKGPPRRVVLRLTALDANGTPNNAPLHNRHQALHRAHRELLSAYNRLELLNDELENKNRQLQEVYRRLSYASKMAAVGELTAGATHGINNPLAAAVSAVRTLDRLCQQCPDELREQMMATCRRADRALERIERIVADLRRLAQAGTRRGDLKVVDLGQEIRLALELISHKLEDIDLKLALPEGLTVRVCPDEFNQVIMNLADNAAAAMDGHGHLTIRALLEGGKLRLEIEDDGPGVPPDMTQRIFEPFFSTKEPGRGTGIGLAVARGIIEGYAGTLYLEQEHGPGCKFVIELPAEVVRERPSENTGG